jgi:hypothetical protein
MGRETQWLDRDKIIPKPAEFEEKLTPVGPKVSMRTLMRKQISKNLAKQERDAERAESLVGRLKQGVLDLAQRVKLKLGLVTALPLTCSCTCPSGTPTDTHYEETIDGYSYTFCQTCINHVGVDPEAPVWSNYYFCKTTAPVSHNRTVTEAIREGTCEAYRTRKKESPAEVRSGADGRSLRVPSSEDSPQEGNAPVRVVGRPGAVGSGVATKELDCSLRQETLSDFDLLDRGDALGDRTEIHIVCLGCTKTLDIESAGGHKC